MRIGIVGCGNIAVIHAQCLKKLPEHELVAFADSKIDRSEAFAKEYGGNAYSSLEEMLEKERLDVIHICTPHYLHTPMAIYGLQQGVHVFMEKPPVITKEQWMQLKKAATHAEQQLGLCFQNRYNPSILKVKDMITSGEAGKVIGARGIVTWNRKAEYYTESDWRGRLEYEGGGALINQSIHTLDLLHYLVGQPLQSVDAVIANHHLKGVIEVEDMMSAYIRYPEAEVCFYVTTAYNADAAPLIEINCEHMMIRIEDLQVTCYYKNGQAVPVPVERKQGFGKSYWGAGHEDCIGDFYQSLSENRPFALNTTSMEETVLLMLGAYESARNGHEVLFQ